MAATNTQNQVKKQSIVERLQSEQMMRMMQNVLPKVITPERFVSIAQSNIRNIVKKYPDVNQASVIACVFQSAMLGLDLNPMKKEAYIVPFNSKVMQSDGSWKKQPVATFIPGYMGLLKLATRADGVVKTMKANIVYENDKFTYKETFDGTVFEHEPAIKDRGEFVKVYTIATLKDGTRDVFIMDRADVYKYRAKSKAYTSGDKSSPWFADAESMIKKTCIRRHCATFPSSDSLDDKLSKAIGLDEKSEFSSSFSVPEELETVDAEFKELADAQIEEEQQTSAKKSTKPVVKKSSKKLNEEESDEPNPVFKKIVQCYNGAGWSEQQFNSWLSELTSKTCLTINDLDDSAANDVFRKLVSACEPKTKK